MRRVVTSTSAAARVAEVEAFLDAVPSSVIVVLDEAYNEYLPAADRAGSVAWLTRHANLVITRTFSAGSSFCTPSVTTLAPSSTPPVITTSSVS